MPPAPKTPIPAPREARTLRFQITDAGALEPVPIET
jgi:hypothetical protein